MKKQLIACLICLLLWMNTVPVFAAEQPVSVYVNASAEDGGNGTPVAPYQTLADAVSAVNTYLEAGKSNITVYLADGIYELSETVQLTSRPAESLAFQAMDGATPVISGRKTVTGWQIHDSTKRIYKAYVGNDTYRQLYVNGERAIRARSEENFGISFASDLTGLVTENTEVATWGKGAELVFVKSFLAPRCVVTKTELTEDGTFLSLDSQVLHMMTQGYGTTSFVAGESPVYVENAYALLDSENEWYHNPEDGYLYYKPRSGVRFNTMTFELPGVETLINLENASNISFSGISFEGASWNAPSENYGFAPAQNGYLTGTCELPPAAVSVNGSQNISFSDCRFSKSGNTGLRLVEGNENISITGCTFVNLSGAGANLGQITARYADQNYNRNITFEYNTVSETCLEYQMSSAVGAGFLTDSSISHNRIYNQPYTGIHIGWGWGGNSVTRGLRVNENHISDVMQELYDGGAIYTLGGTDATAQPFANEISGNYIERVHHNGGGIYSDNGSFGWHIHHNVIDQRGIDSVSENINWYNGAYDAYDNKIEYNFSTLARYSFHGATDLIYQGNVIEENAMWQDMALAVIQNAGVSPKENACYALGEHIGEAVLTDATLFGKECALVENGGTIQLDKDGGFAFEILPLDTVGTLEISLKPSGEQITVTSSNGLSSEQATRILCWQENTSLTVEIGIQSMTVTTDADLTGYTLRYIGGTAAIGTVHHSSEVYQNQQNNLDFQGENLLENGSFEVSADGFSAVGDTTLTHTLQTSCEGIGSLKVETEASENSYVRSPAVTLQKGVTYQLFADVYVDLADGNVYNKEAVASFYLEAPAQSKITGEFWTSLGVQTDNTYLFQNDELYQLNPGWNRLVTYVSVSTTMENCRFSLRTADVLGNPIALTYYLDSYSLQPVNGLGGDYRENFEISSNVGDWFRYGIEVPVSDTTQAYQGKSSLKIVQTVGYGEPRLPVYLEAGHTYQMSVYYYHESETAHTPCFRIYNEKNDNDNIVDIASESRCVTEAPTGEWTLVERSFTNQGASGIYYIAIVSQGKGTKTYWLDGLRIDDMQPEEYGYYRDNFENGMGRWQKFYSTLSWEQEHTYANSAGALRLQKNYNYGEAKLPVSLELGHTYQFEVMVYNTADTDLEAWLRVYGATGANEDILSSGEEITNVVTLPAKTWTRLSRTYTSVANGLCYVSFVSQMSGNQLFYLDDFSMTDISAEWENFHCNLSPWTVSGSLQAASVGAMETKVVPTETDEKFAKRVTMQTGRRYAFYAEVKTAEQSARARLTAEALYTEAGQLTGNASWTENGVFSEPYETVVSSEQWTPLCDVLSVTSDIIPAFDAEISVQVMTDDAQPMTYFIRNVRLFPIDDGKNRALYDVNVYDARLGMTSEGEGADIFVGYRYFDADAKLIDSGYVSDFGQLPQNSDMAKAELFCYTSDGSLLCSAVSDKCYADTKVSVEEATFDGLLFSNTDKAYPDVLLIAAQYDSTGKLVWIDMKAESVLPGRYQTAFSDIIRAESAQTIRFYLWDHETLKPIAAY